MKPLFRNNLPLFLPYLIFLSAGALLLLLNDKTATHLEFNRHHNHFFDLFFFYGTHLGDGYTATIAFIILLTVKFRYALFLGLSNLVSGIITQALKHTLFADVVRPKKFFEGLHELYLVPGVDNHLYNSFPSGHSTSAFAIYFAIGMIVENKSLKFVCFALALLAGYSRIYLSQHFFQDVYAGSLIGVTTTVIFYIVMSRARGEWLNRSLRIMKRSV
ncbi:MAG TPA: phosphatase PAP2 family protein [Bacteroidia bacterium]